VMEGEEEAEERQEVTLSVTESDSQTQSCSLQQRHSLPPLCTELMLSAARRALGSSCLVFAGVLQGFKKSKRADSQSHC
jgi:hypothetical protein